MSCVGVGCCSAWNTVQSAWVMRCMVIFLMSLTLVMLHSCIDGEEEIFIEADGSARVKAVYRVHSMIFSAEDAKALKSSIAEEMEKQPNITLITNDVKLVDGHRVITIELETSDLTSLGETLSGGGESGEEKVGKMLNTILGKIVVSQEGLNVSLRREVDLAPLMEGKVKPSMLGDSEFRYVIHLPKAAGANNAHVVDDDGRTLRWTFRLSETKKHPIILKMVAPIPLPWWVYGAGGLVLVLIAAGGVFLWKRVRRAGGEARKKPSTESTEKGFGKIE